MNKTTSSTDEIQKELDATRATLDDVRKRFNTYVQKLSHDIQSPVKKILSFSDLLTMKLQNETDESVREYIRRIEKNAAILSQILRELREDAKPLD